MSNPDKKRKSREMRIRKVPIAIHKAIVAHQGLMGQRTDDSVTIDDAAIDLWQKAISSIPALNQNA